MKGLLTLIVCGLTAAAVGADVTVAATRSPLTRPAFFCASVSSIQQADVARYGAAPGGRRIYSIPAHVVVRNRAEARNLANALCGLPRFPGGLHCPVDGSLRYEITFAGAGGRVNVDPFGCETVSGAGSLRWAGRTPNFWRTFGAIVSKAHATAATFQGRKA